MSCNMSCDAVCYFNFWLAASARQGAQTKLRRCKVTSSRSFQPLQRRLQLKDVTLSTIMVVRRSRYEGMSSII